MAERRMISRSIIRQEGFLDLRLAAQALYMHLMAEADDDGFVASAKRTVRMLGAKNTDLTELVDAGYVTLFPSGVAHVIHWQMHNNIRKDRYKPTIYVDEKKVVGFQTEEERQPTDNQMTTNCQPNGCQNEGKWQPDDNQRDDIMATQNSIGKEREEKDREEEDRKEEDRKEYLREEEDSNAITDFNSCISEEARIESLLDIIPPEEEIPLEEEIPPELVATIDLPVPLGGRGTAVSANC